MPSGGLKKKPPDPCNVRSGGLTDTPSPPSNEQDDHRLSTQPGRFMRLLHKVTAAVVLMLGTACADSTTGTGRESDALTADVAVVAGDAAYEDVGVIYTQFGAFGAPSGEVGRAGAWQSACPWD